MLFAGQIELFTSIMIQLKTWAWDGASDGDKAAIISCIVTTGFLLTASLFMVKILRVARAKELFTDESYLRRFSAITEGLKTKTKMHLSFQFMMMMRRLSLAFLVVYDSLTAQLLGYRLLMLAVVIYVGQVRVSWSLKYDLAHEFLILV